MTNRDAFIARWQYLIDEYHYDPMSGSKNLEASYEAKSKEFADSVDQLIRESINEFTHGGYPELNVRQPDKEEEEDQEGDTDTGYPRGGYMDKEEYLKR